MASYRELLFMPEIRPLHLEFVERKRAEQLQRQEEDRQRRSMVCGTQRASADNSCTWLEDVLGCVCNPCSRKEGSQR